MTLILSDLQRAQKGLKLDIPMKLPSSANLREHWRVRAKRSRTQRMDAGFLLMGCALAQGFTLPLASDQTATITLTRIAPRSLDSDNTASAFKSVRDGVADALGVDDGSPRLEWKYAQEKGSARVRIEIEVRERAA